MSKKSLYQQNPGNKIPGWRILHRGDVLRATDMQFIPGGNYQVTEELLLSTKCTAEPFEGQILGGLNGQFKDYPSQYHNFFYRKVEVKHEH